jgi:predicted transcriptional regulator
MKDCFAIGQLNRLKIINYLASVEYWETVKSITEATKFNDKTTVYCHCNNLVREGILKSDQIEINGRLTWVYRINRH